MQASAVMPSSTTLEVRRPALQPAPDMMRSTCRDAQHVQGCAAQQLCTVHLCAVPCVVWPTPATAAPRCLPLGWRTQPCRLCTPQTMPTTRLKCPRPSCSRRPLRPRSGRRAPAMAARCGLRAPARGARRAVPAGAGARCWLRWGHAGGQLGVVGAGTSRGQVGVVGAGRSRGQVGFVGAGRSRGASWVIWAVGHAGAGI